MRRAYKFMLLLYPRGYRDQFAEEMLGVFEEAFDKRRAQGWSWSVRFAFAELAGLIAGAAGARFDGRPSPEVPEVSTLPHELAEAPSSREPACVARERRVEQLAAGRSVRWKRAQELFRIERAGRRVLMFEEHVHVAARFEQYVNSIGDLFAIVG